MYRQCTLKSGHVWHHAWIPEQFAVKGKFIQLKNERGHWGTTWEVISTGELTLGSDYVRELERDHLHQRKASDI
jgi:hypothetical protein